MNESVFLPPKVQFISGRVWLQEFSATISAIEEPVKSLLRNYEGLFTYPVSINESYLSRSWKMERDEVRKDLTDASPLMVSSTTSRSGINRNSPCYANGLRPEYLRINMSVVQERKKLAIERADKLKQYVQSKECRSVFVGNILGMKKYNTVAYATIVWRRNGNQQLLDQ